jgi:hypothetical protein
LEKEDNRKSRIIWKRIEKLEKMVLATKEIMEVENLPIAT